MAWLLWNICQKLACIINYQHKLIYISYLQMKEIKYININWHVIFNGYSNINEDDACMCVYTRISCLAVGWINVMICWDF